MAAEAAPVTDAAQCGVPVSVDAAFVVQEECGEIIAYEAAVAAQHVVTVHSINQNDMKPAVCDDIEATVIQTKAVDLEKLRKKLVRQKKRNNKAFKARNIKEIMSV